MMNNKIIFTVKYFYVLYSLKKHHLKNFIYLNNFVIKNYFKYMNIIFEFINKLL